MTKTSPTPTPAPIESTLADELEATARRYEDTLGLSREGAIRRIGKMHDALLDAADALRTPPQSGEVSQEQVEAVARALYKQACIHHRTGELSFDALSDEGRQAWFEQARAAIAAMSPPPPPSAEVGLADRYRQALQSIGNSACCGDCQEAALVAQEALRQQPIGVVEDGVERLTAKVVARLDDASLFNAARIRMLNDMTGCGFEHHFARAVTEYAVRAALSSPTDTKGEAK
jgi:hypothetical protein